jgi:urea ABC transporter ATP-binding protein UrtD
VHAPDDHPILVVDNVTKRFDGLVAVQDVSLQVRPGEMQCIIGPNGAGKSTLFNMMCGALVPSQGVIMFDGRDLRGLPLHQVARLGISRKFQVPSVFEALTVEDNLDLAGGVSGTAGQERIEEILDLIRLREVRGLLASNLAHGQKQWLEIGIALVSHPRLVLLDEPTAGMTREETEATAQLLLSVRGDITIIVIEHDMRFVRALGCHTVVLHQGKLLREGPFEAIETDDIVREIYLGRQ